MALEPKIAEDLIRLLDKYPDLTLVQRAIVKSAATYLVQDEEERLSKDTDFENYDARLRMDAAEYEFVPDRIELLHGIVRPKHWETPNRIAAAQKEREEIAKIEAEGFSNGEVWKEWERRKKAGLL